MIYRNYARIFSINLIRKVDKNLKELIKIQIILSVFINFSIIPRENLYLIPQEKQFFQRENKSK